MSSVHNFTRWRVLFRLWALLDVIWETKTHILKSLGNFPTHPTFAELHLVLVVSISGKAFDRTNLFRFFSELKLCFNVCFNLWWPSTKHLNFPFDDEIQAPPFFYLWWQKTARNVARNLSQSLLLHYILFNHR